MHKPIPSLAFRLEPGYTIDLKLTGPEIDGENILIGGLQSDPENPKMLFLGKIAEYQMMRKNVWLDCERAHAIYVMGKRRSGKTYTLGVIVEGLCSKEWLRQGNNNQAVVLLDTMNVFLTMPYLAREDYKRSKISTQELNKWGIRNESLNIFMFYPRGTRKPAQGNSMEIALRPSDLTAEDWATLFGVDTYSDPIGQLISEVYEKIAIEGYVNSSGEHIPPNSNYGFDSVLQCLSNCPEIERYELRTIEAVRRRFNAVRRLPIFSERGINIRELFCAGQISIFLLRDLEQDLRSLFVGVLVKKIMQFRSISEHLEKLASVKFEQYDLLKNTDQENASLLLAEAQRLIKEAQNGLPRGWIIIDEAHNYMPSKGISPSSQPLRKYVNEGRNLGLSIVVATQNPSALDPAIRRNADILIIHSISMKDDLTTVEGMINTWIPDEFTFAKETITTRVFEQLVRSLPLGYSIISNDRMNRIFVSKIRPRFTHFGGIEY